MFKRLALGNTIRIPYRGDWRYDGTDRTTLHSFSNIFDSDIFDCVIKGIITEKNSRKGEYNPSS